MCHSCMLQQEFADQVLVVAHGGDVGVAASVGGCLHLKCGLVQHDARAHGAEHLQLGRLRSLWQQLAEAFARAKALYALRVREVVGGSFDDNGQHLHDRKVHLLVQVDASQSPHMPLQPHSSREHMRRPLHLLQGLEQASDHCL